MVDCEAWVTPSSNSITQRSTVLLVNHAGGRILVMCSWRIARSWVDLCCLASTSERNLFGWREEKNGKFKVQDVSGTKKGKKKMYRVDKAGIEHDLKSTKRWGQFVILLRNLK